MVHLHTQSSERGKKSCMACRSAPISSIMTRDPVCIDAATSATQLAVILDENEISGAPVIDSQGRAIGVVSRVDLLHRIVEGPLGSQPGSFLNSIAEGFEGQANSRDLGMVSEFMNPDVICAMPDETIQSVATRMAEERVHRVLIVESSREVVGIVTSLDLVKALADS